MLKPFEGGSVGAITFWQEEIYLLFGKEYPLGAIKPVVLPAKLANEAEFRAFLDQGSCGKSHLEFIPDGDGRFIKEYVNWHPHTNESSE